MTHHPTQRLPLLLALCSLCAVQPLHATGVSPPRDDAEPARRPRVWVNRTEGVRDADKGRHVAVDAFDGRSQFRYTDKIHWEGTLKPWTYYDIEYELTSDEVMAMEVVLLVANGWEERVSVVLRASRDAKKSADPSHIKAYAKCNQVSDDCAHQKYFQYTLPPYVEKNSPFQGRLAFRAHAMRHFWPEPMTGKWTLTIRNGLPDNAHDAHVKLMVFQGSYAYVHGMMKGLACVIAFACICAMAGTCVSWGHEGDGASRANTGNSTPWAERLEQTLHAAGTRLRDAGARVHGRYARAADEDADAAEAEEDEDDEECCCRICKATHPRADLFSPCNCSGTMRYIHRGCLEEWRAKTTSSANRKRCSECHAPFTVVVKHAHGSTEFALSAISKMTRAVLLLLLVEGAVVGAGWGFKLCAGLLTNDLDHIKWNPDPYHHLVGATVVFTSFFHYTVLQPTLSRANVVMPVRVVIVVLSLVLEVAAGYVGEFLWWLTGPGVWDWQVRFCTGYSLVAIIYAFVMHNQRVARAAAAAAAVSAVAAPVDGEDGAWAEGGEEAASAAEDASPAEDGEAAAPEEAAEEREGEEEEGEVEGEGEEGAPVEGVAAEGADTREAAAEDAAAEASSGGSGGATLADVVVDVSSSEAAEATEARPPPPLVLPLD